MSRPSGAGSFTGAPGVGTRAVELPAMGADPVLTLSDPTLPADASADLAENSGAAGQRQDPRGPPRPPAGGPSSAYRLAALSRTDTFAEVRRATVAFTVSVS